MGTATWLPCNNSLTDKASFGFRLDAPARSRGSHLVAVANGRLLSRRSHGRRIRWNWAMEQPMAPYLATVAFDNFRLRHARVDGIPSWTAVGADLYSDRGALIRRGIRNLPEIIRFERKLFGPYPFDAVGTTITDGGEYALETQSRPTYPGPPRRNLLVHELAHQWVGDSTGLRRWPDIWLNEGFATFTEWVYRERHGGPSARSVFAELRRRPPTDPFWSPPPGRPGYPEESLRRVGLRPRRDDPRSAADQASATAPSSASCGPGRRPTATATSRPRSSSPSRSAIRAARSDPCCGAGCFGGATA